MLICGKDMEIKTMRYSFLTHHFENGAKKVIMQYGIVDFKIG